MNKNPIIEKKLSVLINGVRKEIETSLNFEVSFCEYFKGLSGREKIAHFKRFRAEALIKPFTLKTDDGTTVKVLWKDMTKKQKSAIKTRLWRLGKLISVKLGKTPTRTTRTTPVNENGNVGQSVVLPEELSGKAPKEKSRGLKEVLSALLERTGWTKLELLEEITAILG